MKSLKRFKAATLFLATALIAVLFILSLPSGTASKAGYPKTETAHSNSVVSDATKTTPQPALMRLRIPAISLDTGVIKTGIMADGSIQPPNRFDVAAWYDHSPTPGDIGPSVIVGHVDSRQGTAVFWRLRQLKAGQTIVVDRDDGKTATFKITEVAQYHKNSFPSQSVYGKVSYAGIRLITCGGTFNSQTRQYSDNIVVYGILS